MGGTISKGVQIEAANEYNVPRGYQGLSEQASFRVAEVC